MICCGDPKREQVEEEEQSQLFLCATGTVIANKVYLFKMLAQLKTAVIIKEEVINLAN